ncbi:hypothetical protein TNCT_149341 [Trichonephila clavata]|uniref:Uncharacterized protein n=1 Tax=Trichonephila clavata TaxID=2740835 RepID=A0A8X6FR71_TRICU|nr:hypothetical protein TNCT_149341 [Trichonephila clavata]
MISLRCPHKKKPTLHKCGECGGHTSDWFTRPYPSPRRLRVQVILNHLVVMGWCSIVLEQHAIMNDSSNILKQFRQNLL